MLVAVDVRMRFLTGDVLSTVIVVSMIRDLSPISLGEVTVRDSYDLELFIVVLDTFACSFPFTKDLVLVENVMVFSVFSLAVP